MFFSVLLCFSQMLLIVMLHISHHVTALREAAYKYMLEIRQGLMEFLFHNFLSIFSDYDIELLLEINWNRLWCDFGECFMGLSSRNYMVWMLNGSGGPRKQQDGMQITRHYLNIESMILSSGKLILILILITRILRNPETQTEKSLQKYSNRNSCSLFKIYI